MRCCSVGVRWVGYLDGDELVFVVGLHLVEEGKDLGHHVL